MGQRMPDEPIEFGDDCFLGWSPGETPKHVYARFILMERCILEFPPQHPIPPNDRTFKLTQVDGFPCTWRVNAQDWQVTFNIIGGPTRTTLILENTADFSGYFYEQVVAFQHEGIVFHNDIDICRLWYGAKNGLGVVTWTPQATEILEGINLGKGEDVFMELRPLVNNNLVYKFCRIQDATNIAILFDPSF